MPVSILMPALSPTMTEGTLSKWIKKEGDMVEAGDVIAEIETDKATMEVEAVDEGKIVKLLVEEGASGVAVNAMIAVLLEEDEDESSVEAFLKQGGKPQNTANADADKSENSPAVSSSQSSAPSTAPASTSPTAQTGRRVLASPLARRLAEQSGLNLSNIRGSGPNGRVVKSDVESAKKSGNASLSANAAKSAGGALPAAQGPDARQLADMLGMPYEATPNSNIRKTIANRLLESKVTVPHFYLTVDCKLDALLDVRAQLNDEANGAYKLSVNDFIIKASALALKKVPAANTAWTESHILQFDAADISVAVATDSGLITPIIHSAEDKSLQDISASMKDLAGRAREGKLKPAEYQGGTFSISNLGMFGVKHFSAIINPPQACILAVGAGAKMPVVMADGQLGVGTVMSCTLSCDHRVVDGAVGAQFLQVFQDFVEHPIKMFA